jgi:hypothetical protein
MKFSQLFGRGVAMSFLSGAGQLGLRAPDG